MMENGKMVKLMGKAHFIILMEIFMKENLEMIEPMAMVLIIIKMDQNIKEVGRMI